MKYYALKIRVVLMDSEKTPDRAEWDRKHNNMFFRREEAEKKRKVLRDFSDMGE